MWRSEASTGAAVACFPLQPRCSRESPDLSGQLRNHTQPVMLTSSPTLQAEVAQVAPVNVINRSHLILIILRMWLQHRFCQRAFALSCDTRSLFVQTAASAPRQTHIHTHNNTGPPPRVHCFAWEEKKRKEKEAVARFPTLKRPLFSGFLFNSH